MGNEQIKQYRQSGAPVSIYPTGEVYFITDGEFIKIGYSGSAVSRLKDLQAINSRPLIILTKAPGTIEDEHRAHIEFAHARVRGEWFRMAPDLMDLIEAVKQRGTLHPLKAPAPAITEIAPEPAPGPLPLDLIAFGKRQPPGPVRYAAGTLAARVRMQRDLPERDTWGNELRDKPLMCRLVNEQAKQLKLKIAEARMQKAR